jgi:hypothetical protein
MSRSLSWSVPGQYRLPADDSNARLPVGSAFDFAQARKDPPLRKTGDRGLETVDRRPSQTVSVPARNSDLFMNPIFS